MSSQAKINRSATVGRTLFIGAVLPCCSFFIWFALSVLHQRSIAFSRADLAICGGAGIFLLFIAMVRARSPLLARLALLQWSLLMFLVPAELGLRLVFRQPPAPWYPNTVREITLSTPLEGVRGRGTFTTNELGLRGRPMSLHQLNRTPLSVLCVGGSTTECFYNSDEHAWPACMESLLSAKTGADVFVGNAGRGGHLVKHHCWQLSHYRYAPQFDVVVILCGWNDLSAILFHDPSAPPRNIADESLTRGVDFTAAMEPHTAFYRNLAVGRLLQQAVFKKQWNPARNVGWRAVVQDPYGNWIAERRKIRKGCLATAARNLPPQGFEEGLACYESDLEAIRAALHPGQLAIFATQPTLCRSGLTEELDGRLWSCDGKRVWTAEATALMLRRLNDTMREFCSRHGIACVDAERAMSGDPELFYDDCHFSDAGCKAIARLIAEQVLAVAERNSLLRGP